MLQMNELDRERLKQAYEGTRPLLPRLLMPLICLLIRKAVARDLDAIKAFSEREYGH